MLSWWASAVLATPAFGSEDPLAPVDRGSWYHQDLTTAAAVAEGWSAGAAAELGRHTFGVDLYAYHAVWVVSGGRSRRRGAGLARAPLLNVHFDNLASTAEIAEIWRRVNGGAVAGILAPASAAAPGWSGAPGPGSSSRPGRRITPGRREGCASQSRPGSTWTPAGRPAPGCAAGT